ncbi:MAG: dioxygenase [Gammaproteobacteria bacterium]|nr:dioxygenase [Gammaproteobacteria bacterium]
MRKTPALFVSHGSPMLMVDEQDGADYRRWGKELGKPRAILVFSAHWQTPQLSGGEIKPHTQLIYDFGGFPPELYTIQYPAPGAAEIVKEVEDMLGTSLPIQDRGLDHGVYVPFIHMWPLADVPVLQLSLPRNMSERELYELGQKLSPLRKKDILIIGAGALTHNLRAFNPYYQSDEPYSWAREFDEWLEDVLIRKDIDALLNWKQAPQARQNHPTDEHFLPLFIAAGAGEGEVVSFPTLGFSYGAFSRRSAQFG